MSELTSRNLSRLEDQDEVLSMVKKEINKSEVQLSHWKTKLVKWYELYKMVQSHRHYEGLANIFVPEIMRAVETVVANLYRNITAQPPYFEYKGREKFDEPSARALTQLTEFQMDENNFKIRLMDSLRQLAVTGLTVRKILWDFRQIRQTRKKATSVTEIDILTQKPRTRKQIEKETVVTTVSDVWTFEDVDLLTFHISDITTSYVDIQKARWIGEQYRVDRQWIDERIKKDWLASDQVEKLDQPTDAKSVSSPASHFVDRRNQISGYHTQEQEGKIEIIERWGLVKAGWVHTEQEMAELGIDADDQVEGVIILANRTAILKLEANPFWHGMKPYVSAPYIAQEGELPGMGVAQIGESLQEELNDTRNQGMDNKTLILANMWLKKRSAGIKNKDLRIRPMGVIQTNDMDGLKPLRPPVLTGVGLTVEAVIKDDLRQSVGAPSNLQGIPQRGVNTATEATALNVEGSARTSHVADMYGQLVIKPMLIMAEFLNYQFYDRVKVIKVIGEQGVKFRELTPDEIVGNKDVVINIASDTPESPAVKRQQLIQFFTLLQGMAPEGMQFHWGSLNKIYKAFFPHGDLADLYTPPPDEVELLTAEDELDLVLGENPVLAKPGQDHEAHMQQHQEDFDSMKFALNETQFRLFTDLISSHEAELNSEMEAAVAAREQELQQAGPGGKGGIDRGRTPNATPFTNRPATTDGEVLRNSRVGG